MAMLRGRDFGGVEAAIDMDDGAAVVGEFVGLGVGESFDEREAARGVFVLVERRRDSCAEEMTAIYQSRPRVVLPTRTSLSLSVDCASFWK